jgi:heme exporter protein D
MPDLDMSPYGPFVWGAYGVSLAMLGALTWSILSRARATARRLAEMEPPPPAASDPS